MPAVAAATWSGYSRDLFTAIPYAFSPYYHTKITLHPTFQTTGLAPSFEVHSAILITLQPGNYTAILSGNNASTGVCLVELYAIVGGGLSVLANVSTRVVVGTNQNV